MGRQTGISPEQIANLHDYRSNRNFSETERLALEYTDRMTSTPVEVFEALFARLREKFSDAQLVELTSSIAWENYRARFDQSLAGAAGRVCDHGHRASGSNP